MYTKSGWGFGAQLSSSSSSFSFSPNPHFGISNRGDPQRYHFPHLLVVLCSKDRILERKQLCSESDSSSSLKFTFFMLGFCWRLFVLIQMEKGSREARANHSGVAPAEPDFPLQWGCRKRLRRIKVRDKGSAAKSGVRRGIASRNVRRIADQEFPPQPPLYPLR